MKNAAMQSDLISLLLVVSDKEADAYWRAERGQKQHHEIDAPDPHRKFEASNTSRNQVNALLQENARLKKVLIQQILDKETLCEALQSHAPY